MKGPLFAADARAIPARIPAGAGAASNTSQRFHPGEPPHAGWWLSAIHDGDVLRAYGWRWFADGVWSVMCPESYEPAFAKQRAAMPLPPGRQAVTYWSNFYPANARVPRIDPRTLAGTTIVPGGSLAELTPEELAKMRRDAAHTAAIRRPVTTALAAILSGQPSMDEARRAGRALASLGFWRDPATGTRYRLSAGEVQELAEFANAPLSGTGARLGAQAAAAKLAPTIADLVREGYLQRPAVEATPAPDAAQKMLESAIDVMERAKAHGPLGQALLRPGDVVALLAEVRRLQAVEAKLGQQRIGVPALGSPLATALELLKMTAGNKSSECTLNHVEASDLLREYRRLETMVADKLRAPAGELAKIVTMLRGVGRIHEGDGSFTMDPGSCRVLLAELQRLQRIEAAAVPASRHPDGAGLPSYQGTKA